jgi:transcriptional/translational regulatory protein YebC/TACO1
VLTSPENFDAVLTAVKGAVIEPEAAEIDLIPQNYIKLQGPEAKQMLKLMDALEDHDDVQKVSANFDIDEADMMSA